jgi:hypothetical protein
MKNLVAERCIEISGRKLVSSPIKLRLRVEISHYFGLKWHLGLIWSTFYQNIVWTKVCTIFIVRKSGRHIYLFSGDFLGFNSLDDTDSINDQLHAWGRSLECSNLLKAIQREIKLIVLICGKQLSTFSMCTPTLSCKPCLTCVSTLQRNLVRYIDRLPQLHHFCWVTWGWWEQLPRMFKRITCW